MWSLMASSNWTDFSPPASAALGLDDNSAQPPSLNNRGYCASREQAMADFKARWQTV